MSNNETLLIAGGTGFVGRHLLKELRGQPFRIRCLVRDEKKAEWVKSLGYEAAIGDISSPESLQTVFSSVDRLIHLVGIIEEKGRTTFKDVHVDGTLNLVDACKKNNVRRIFYQSALGADPESIFHYLKTKGEAEQIVMSSGIPYTIFRPSLIIGQGDGFTERLIQLISAGPVVPIPGEGTARFQPIYIHDWIKCFFAVFDKDSAINSMHSFGGPEHITFIDIVREIMNTLNIKKPIIHVPLGLINLSLPFMGLIRPLVRTFGRELPPFTRQLLSLLNIDNICKTNSVEKNFGFSPIRFADALKQFL